MLTTVLSRMTISWATPSTARIHHRMAWFAAWSAVSATSSLPVVSATSSWPAVSPASSGEVPGGLIDSSCDWDNVISPLVRALSLAVTPAENWKHPWGNSHRPENDGARASRIGLTGLGASAEEAAPWPVPHRGLLETGTMTITLITGANKGLGYETARRLI